MINDVKNIRRLLVEGADDPEIYSLLRKLDAGGKHELLLLLNDSVICDNKDSFSRLVELITEASPQDAVSALYSHLQSPRVCNARAAASVIAEFSHDIGRLLEVLRNKKTRDYALIGLEARILGGDRLLHSEDEVFEQLMKCLSDLDQSSSEFDLCCNCMIALDVSKFVTGVVSELESDIAPSLLRCLNEERVVIPSEQLERVAVMLRSNKKVSGEFAAEAMVTLAVAGFPGTEQIASQYKDANLRETRLAAAEAVCIVNGFDPLTAGNPKRKELSMIFASLGQLQEQVGNGGFGHYLSFSTVTELTKCGEYLNLIGATESSNIVRVVLHGISDHSFDQADVISTGTIEYNADPDDRSLKLLRYAAEYVTRKHEDQ